MTASTGAGKEFFKGRASSEARGLPKKEGARHLTGTMESSEVGITVAVTFLCT